MTALYLASESGSREKLLSRWWSLSSAATLLKGRLEFSCSQRKQIWQWPSTFEIVFLIMVWALWSSTDVNFRDRLPLPKDSARQKSLSWRFREISSQDTWLRLNWCLSLQLTERWEYSSLHVGKILLRKAGLGLLSWLPVGWRCPWHSYQWGQTLCSLQLQGKVPNVGVAIVPFSWEPRHVWKE